MYFWRINLAFSSLIQEKDRMKREKLIGITDPSNNSAALLEGTYRISVESLV
jgi:hypothetical protein